MEKILDMIAQWSPIGQGIFFLIVIGGVFSLIKQLAHYTVSLFRGWPPEQHDEEEKE